jgi:hypothetical protein
VVVLHQEVTQLIVAQGLSPLRNWLIMPLILQVLLGVQKELPRKWDVNRMPSVQKGEKSKSYMSRCIPVVKKEGKTQEQAVGQCYGMFKSKWTAKKGKR